MNESFLSICFLSWSKKQCFIEKKTSVKKIKNMGSAGMINRLTVRNSTALLI